MALPILTASVVDTNATTIALTGDNKKLIKYYSNALATMSATAQNGATIDQDMYVIRNGSRVGYGKSYTFNNVESNVFTFSAQDNQGNVGKTTVTATMVNYVKLTCNIEASNPDLTGNITVKCNGSFFNGSFGAKTNTLTVRCRYSDSYNTFVSNWFSMTVTKSGNRYSAYTSFTIPNFNDREIYEIECRAEDTLSSATSLNHRAKSTPVFHWGENDFAFEVPVDMKAGISTGDLWLNNGSNYGSRIRFGDSDYCYIAEESDDAMTLHATSINLDASSVQLYGNPVADFPIETGTEAMGTNGTWYWTKWKSGKAECYGTRNFGKVAINNACGSVFEGYALSQNFPTGLFIAAPDSVQMMLQRADTDAWLVSGESGANAVSSPQFRLMRHTAITTSCSYVSFHVTGRWK